MHSFFLFRLELLVAMEFLLRLKALGVLEKQVEQVRYTDIACSPEIKSSSAPQ